jgi:hypothetical protein
MLKKRLDSVAGAENGKGSSRSWMAPDRGLLSSLVVIVLLPAALAAQLASTTTTTSPVPTVYGSGYQLPLEFEGERTPVNEISVSAGVSTFYDDNVLGTNADRLSDEAASFDARLGIHRRTKRLTFSLDYVPFFTLYRQISQYDRTNQTANLNLSYRLSARTLIGLNETFGYQNGIYPALASGPTLSGLPSPIGLNGIIVPYTIRTLTDVSGVYLTFMKSRSTSLTFTGGYSQSKYGPGKQQNIGLLLYNGQGFSGGMTLQHYISAHTTLGILALHQDTTYQGGLVFGSHQRTQIESLYFSGGSALSPSLTVSLFGGPQYVRTLGLVSMVDTLSGHFQFSGGGSVTKQVRKTALNLAITRSVTDGGGLYTSVVNDRAIFSARRRLIGTWEGDLHVGAAREDTSLFQFVNGKIDGVIAGVTVNRKLLTQGLVFHVSYDTMHQLSKGPLPLVANFDRNQVSAGFDYQLKSLNLGR